ncbi:NUDIX domain-containing protein [Roseivirga sp. BDSF3-8]|uniref:NUDIX hydrolase n=1 Tax=Roseivirga sp. BDSF3-8 TaxID=3241598 RepID=UPI0035325E3E
MSELYELLKEWEPDLKENHLPGVTVDCVVFGYYDRSMRVLLVKPKSFEQWMLPGGFVRKDLSLDEAASRILADRSGAKNIFLSQFRVFGKTGRTDDFYRDMPDDLWLKNRFISVGYYGLVDYHHVTPVTDAFSNACEWKELTELPELVMDHKEILDEALHHLRRDLNDKPVGLNLLPEKFTMPDLQRLYEIILDKKLNRGNFYRKMLRYGILVKLDEVRKGGAHKAPDLYSFDTEAYQKALETGLQDSW